MAESAHSVNMVELVPLRIREQTSPVATGTDPSVWLGWGCWGICHRAKAAACDGHEFPEGLFPRWVDEGRLGFVAAGIQIPFA